MELKSEDLKVLVKAQPASRSLLLFGDVSNLISFATLASSVDVVLAADFIEHLTNRAALLQNPRLLLVSGGVVLITAPNALRLLNVLGSRDRHERVDPLRTLRL